MCVYPKHITLTNQLTVYSDFNVLASIVNQDFNITSNNVRIGIVTLLTSVQSPYLLVSPVSISDNNDKFIVNINNNISISALFATSYSQYWSLSIIHKLGQCNLDDQYIFNYTVGCHPLYNGCPIEKNKESIVFELTSEEFCPSYNGCPIENNKGSVVFEFCPSLIENIDIFGLMNIYNSSTYLYQKPDFILDQTVFLKFTTQSLEATLTQVTLDNLQIKLWDNTSLILILNGILTSSENMIQLILLQLKSLLNLNSIKLYSLFVNINIKR